jgi:dethiobiotin synthetase
MRPRLPGIFVVGTDTGVGKTRVTAGVARALGLDGRRVGVLKPVATGATKAGDGWRCEDAERLIEAVGGGLRVERVAPIVYEEPLAPSVAARRSSEPLLHSRVEREVDAALTWWEGRAEVMVIEGIGGLLCPLAEESTVADLAVTIDYPIVIVARSSLGTLNHTLLTVEAARLRSLRVAGLVLNSPAPPIDRSLEGTNALELARRLPGVPLLADLPFEPNLAFSDLLLAVDWFDRVALPRSEFLG